MGVSERTKERERECFSLPLATVGGVRLQPVVFSHTHTPLTHTFQLLLPPSLARQPVGPRGVFDIFFFLQMLLFASSCEMKAVFQG